jgi:two-component system CheB/CheR fusion protein
MPGKDRKKVKPIKNPISIVDEVKIKDDSKINKVVDSSDFPIVGIGASAGGLAAFEAFFSGIPNQNSVNLAFVLIQHLAPDHKSILAEIIKRYTKMEVVEVTDGMKVEPNCVYIIPPNRNMSFLNGYLQLFEIFTSRGTNMPIDFFFRSLANDQHEKAICVILSGTGSDGTLGLRAIKGEGGMAIVQPPQSTEYDGMPLNAIATGLVDYQLLPADMGKQIIAYLTHANDYDFKYEQSNILKEETSLKKIFVLIRNQTGHDFSKYKPNTINRRIQRRLAVNQIESLPDYVQFLQQNPNEIKCLFADFLIGVTSFFRDKETFSKLEEIIIPNLFENKPTGSNIRIWCAGCSTGEEAYSIAILIQERIERLQKNFNIQLFATDIDSKAIAVARTGIFSRSIAQDVSAERLERFFTLRVGADTYQINETIREMLVFSEQSIIKDPPFSHLDLISCRNLMIYLDKELQNKIIPMFHYALNEKGFLFLGTSETIGEYDELFKIFEHKIKIYQKKVSLISKTFTQLVPSTREVDFVMTKQTVDSSKQVKYSLKDLAEQAILKESAIIGILVNEKGDILYLHGHSGLYLELNPGESGINNVLKMAREGLKRELSNAFHQAVENRETIRVEDVNVKTNGHFTKVNLTIKVIMKGLTSEYDNPLFIILLDNQKEQDTVDTQESTKVNLPVDIDKQLQQLKIELKIKEDYLQTSNEELETSNEELKSSNEEMQSVNEELQSTNEELETSKEELQSINEELSTVNSELQIKLHDLSQVNNDMNNLLAGTNIATVFLDLQQKILRFTPKADKIVNLIASDLGRPISHIVTNLLNYNQLTHDVKTVLETLVPKTIEVQTLEGKWFSMIIQPYRTIDNVIEGTVISFLDISEAKYTNDLLAVSEFSYRTLFETTHEGILILDKTSGKILKVNPFLIKLLGYSEIQFLEKEIWDIGFFKDIIPNKNKFSEMQKKKNIQDIEFELESTKNELIAVEFTFNHLEISSRKLIQCNIRDVRDRKKAELLSRKLFELETVKGNPNEEK